MTAEHVRLACYACRTYEDLIKPVCLRVLNTPWLARSPYGAMPFPVTETFTTKNFRRMGDKTTKELQDEDEAAGEEVLYTWAGPADAA